MNKVIRSLFVFSLFFSSSFFRKYISFVNKEISHLLSFNYNNRRKNQPSCIQNSFYSPLLHLQLSALILDLTSTKSALFPALSSSQRPSLSLVSFPRPSPNGLNCSRESKSLMLPSTSPLPAKVNIHFPKKN